MPSNFIFFFACGTVALAFLTVCHCQRDASWQLERIWRMERKQVWGRRWEDGDINVPPQRRRAFSGYFFFPKLKWNFFLEDHFEISKSSETTRTHLEHSAMRIKTVTGMFLWNIHGFRWLPRLPAVLDWLRNVWNYAVLGWGSTSLTCITGPVH